MRKKLFLELYNCCIFEMFEIKNLRVDKNIDKFFFFISEKEEISPEAKTDEIKGTAADFET